MSRHKLVRNLDLEDELGEYDGEDYDGEEEEEIRMATAQVRSLGVGATVSDQQIRDSLWHYYNDIEKTVEYLTREPLSKGKQGKKMAKNDGGFCFSFSL